MMRLLDEVLEAHGGFARWDRMRQVEGTLESGGKLLETKTETYAIPPRQFTVGMREVWAKLSPIGSKSYVDFTAERVALVAEDGTVLAEEEHVRDSFAGHGFFTPWNALQRAYFSGYALWNYFNLPFLLTMPGVRLQEVEPVEVEGEMLDGVGASIPEALPTHCREQRFFFGGDRRLRRHDYRVDIAGGFQVSQYVGDYVSAEGIEIPTTRRAFLRDDRGQTRWDELMVSLSFSDIRFSSRLAPSAR
jgi:hypothetical protein